MIEKSVYSTKENKSNHPTLVTVWYKDYLLYVYCLLAVVFWIIYLQIFPVDWSVQPLSAVQWKLFAQIVLAYPILEEITFRYGLQGWLHHYRWGKINFFTISTANVLSSLLFSALHITIRPDDKSTYFVIIPSLVFGLFKDRHRHIYSCTLLHMFYNIGIFFLLILPSIK